MFLFFRHPDEGNLIKGLSFQYNLAANAILEDACVQAASSFSFCNHLN
jgi:hypothetical protein